MTQYCSIATLWAKTAVRKVRRRCRRFVQVIHISVLMTTLLILSLSQWHRGEISTMEVVIEIPRSLISTFDHDDPMLVDLVRRCLLTHPRKNQNFSSTFEQKKQLMTSMPEHLSSTFVQWLVDVHLLQLDAHGFFVQVEYDNTFDQTIDTLVFEEEFGWDGLIIEGNMETFRSLSQLQRRSRTCFANVCSVELVKQRETVEETNSPCLELHTLFLAAEVPKDIDVLILNNEATAFDILRAFPLERYNIYVIAIKAGGVAETSLLNVYLTGHSYDFVARFKQLPSLEKVDGQLTIKKPILRDTEYDIFKLCLED